MRTRATHAPAQVTDSYMIICLFIVTSTTITLCLVFVPKVIELIRNPDDNQDYRKGMLKTNTNASKVHEEEESRYAHNGVTRGHSQLLHVCSDSDHDNGMCQMIDEAEAEKRQLERLLDDVCARHARPLQSCSSEHVKSPHYSRNCAISSTTMALVSWWNYVYSHQKHM